MLDSDSKWTSGCPLWANDAHQLVHEPPQVALTAERKKQSSRSRLRPSLSRHNQFLMESCWVRLQDTLHHAPSSQATHRGSAPRRHHLPPAVLLHSFPGPLMDRPASSLDHLLPIRRGARGHSHAPMHSDAHTHRNLDQVASWLKIFQWFLISLEERRWQSSP